MRHVNLSTRMLAFMLINVLCFSLMSVTTFAVDNDTKVPEPPGCMEDDMNYALPNKLCIAHGYSQELRYFYKCVEDYLENCAEDIPDYELPEAPPREPGDDFIIKVPCPEDCIYPNKPCIIKGLDRCW